MYGEGLVYASGKKCMVIKGPRKAYGEGWAMSQALW